MAGSKVSRRRFLLAAGGVAAVSMFSCGGLAALGADATAVDFGGTSCIKEGTMKKVLVAYASKCGSTAEVAEAIAARLCQRGETVDVRTVDSVKDLSAYKAVVLGSAIRIGHWLPAAVKFVQEQAGTLRQMPTAFFTVHMQALDDSEKSRAQRLSYIEPVHAILEPRQEAFFAGRVAAGKMDLGARLMMKAMGAKDEDRRDWPAIHAWADGLSLN